MSGFPVIFSSVVTRPGWTVRYIYSSYLIPLVVSSEGSERDGAGQQSGGRRGADHQLRHQHQGLLRQAAQVHELRH